ncbi:MAG: DUF3592 domain-containing protein [Oscillospiraceae bacterium]|nr:DUF3592 domain-containing protein [Oscillospiraceae bacterium]
MELTGVFGLFIFVLLALAMPLNCFEEVNGAKKIIRTGKFTVGTVIKNKTSKYGTYPVVSFTAQNKEYICLCPYRVGEFPEGMEIKVWYLPDDPQKYFCGSINDFVSSSVLRMAGGIIVMVIAIIMMVHDLPDLE